MGGTETAFGVETGAGAEQGPGGREPSGCGGRAFLGREEPRSRPVAGVLRGEQSLGCWEEKASEYIGASGTKQTLQPGCCHGCSGDFSPQLPEHSGCRNRPG